MKRLTSVAKITDPYLKRILSYIIGEDPLRVLAATPRALQRYTRKLSKAQIHEPPAKKKWSVGEIITHLCDTEVVLGFRFRMVISQPGCSLRAMDQNKWASCLKYRRADWRRKLALFTAVRKDHLQLLRSLSSQDWKKHGYHEERGRETLELMVQMLAGHDVNHLRQIRSIRDSSLKREKR